MLLSILVLDAAGWSQAVLLEVSGQVLDPSKAVIPGARVTLQTRPSGPEQTALTDATGTFRFSGVKAGSYELGVEARSFRRASVSIMVGTRPPQALRIVLQIAELKEEVMTVDRQERVNTDPGGNRDVIRLDRQLLDDLPVLGQDVIGAAMRFLDPGALGSGGVTLVVDGMETSEKGVSASAIQEVRINQNPYSAEFSRPGRGRIEVITKPGSTEYHGTFNFLFRDHHLDARNAFAASRPEEQRRIFEGHLTGPLGKSRRTSFLISANREEDDLESIVYARVPTGLVLQNVANPQRDTELSVRVNRQVGKNNTFSFRYEFVDESARNSGVGGFQLPEVAVDSSDREHHIYYNHRRVITPRLILEFFLRGGTHNAPARSRDPALRKVVVLDAFTGGGAQADRLSTENHVQINESLAWSRGKHLVKTGVNIPDISRRGSSDRTNTLGTYLFSSLEDYVRGSPFLFAIQQGDGHLAFWQKDFGVFLQDDVRLRPNLSVGIGFRHDLQNYLGDHNNLAPRVSFAFSPDRRRKTVIRGGAGYFYDRTGSGMIADTLRYGGRRLRQILIVNPSYPEPQLSGPSVSARPESIVRFAPDLRSPYSVQWSLGLEAQLRKSTSASVTYTEIRGVKLFRSRDVNAPLPPDYRRPDPAVGVVRQVESSGSSKARSLELALRGDITRFWNGTIHYTVGRAYSNTSGTTVLPANSYDLSGEWSRADFDERHRFHLFGTFKAANYFKLGIGLSLGSGRPFSLTTGRDDNRDGFASDRPTGVGRNSLDGPGSATLDLRWSREFRRRSRQKDAGPAVTVGLDVFNVLNRVNYAGYIGNLSSSLFGLPVAARPARRVQLSLRLNF